MHRIVFSIFILICLSYSCSKPKQQETVSSAALENYAVQYAKGFRVIKSEGYTHVMVNNPWDTTKLLHSYVLVSKNENLPSHLPKGTIIRTPIGSSAVMSVIHCTTLNELNSLAIIKGICEPHYVDIEYIRGAVASKQIIDLGMARNPSTEALIMLNPEVIFSDPVTGQSQGNLEKTKIPIIQTPDYTEPHPLGRAEWIRFYSLFIEKEELADSLFTITAKNYNEIKSIVANADNKPRVFTDTRYQGSWNMAGGKSYMASLFADAGADYIWSDNESTTFLPLSFEAVLDKAGNGDTWLIRYYAEKDMTYSSLEKEFKSYTYFKAFKEKNIYGCNTMYSKYFVDLPIHPDYILKDLANVFHPNIFPDYESRYYKKMMD